MVDQSLLQTVKGKLGPELPLTIRIEGPFPSFVTFINRLENYQRLISVEGIEMSRTDEFNSDNVEVKLNIRAYLKK